MAENEDGPEGMTEAESMEVGRAAFEAYKAEVGGETWDGQPMHNWGDDQISERQKHGWAAAGKAAIHKALEMSLREEGESEFPDHTGN